MTTSSSFSHVGGGVAALYTNADDDDDDGDAKRVGDVVGDGRTDCGDSRDDGGGDVMGDVMDDVGVCDDKDSGDDGGGGGGVIADAVTRHFFRSPNRKSLSANGDVIRLRGAAFVTVVLSSYAALNCCRPVLIFRQ